MRTKYPGLAPLALPLLLLAACPTEPPDPETGFIAGSVRASGTALSGAEVTLEPGTQTATSDAAGAFRFDDLTPGEYTVVAGADGYADCEPLTVTVNAGAGSAANLVLERLPDPGWIAGSVVDAKTGRPVRGAVLTTVPAAAEAATDAEGLFDLSPLPPGDYAVQVVAAGYEDALEENVTVSEGQGVTVDFSLVAVVTYASTCESCHLQESALLASLAEDPIPEDPGEGGSAGEG